jgi:hypothetical protein
MGPRQDQHGSNWRSASQIPGHHREATKDQRWSAHVGHRCSFEGTSMKLAVAVFPVSFSAPGRLSMWSSSFLSVDTFAWSAHSLVFVSFMVLKACRAWESNPHEENPHGILSPERLPFRQPGTLAVTRTYHFLAAPRIDHRIPRSLQSPEQIPLELPIAVYTNATRTLRAYSLRVSIVPQQLVVRLLSAARPIPIFIPGFLAQSPQRMRTEERIT